jgi:glycosyltransferase involved in cell wall biosynthesis
MLIINRLVVGGSAINSLEVIRTLQSDFNIILVTGSRETDELELNLPSAISLSCEIIRVPSLQRSINPFTDIKAFFELRSIIANRRPQIVHTIGAKPGFIGRLAAKLCHVPVIIHAYHGHVFNAYFNPIVSKFLVLLERIAAKWSTRLISVSEKQVYELAEKYRIAPLEKMVHLPIGINQSRFKDEDGSKRKAFRKKYLLNDQEIAVGIVGRIVPVKDHAFFLEVAALVKHVRNLRFFIVGDGEKLRLKLENKASEMGIDHTFFPHSPRKAFITFTSWLGDMAETMSGLDLVVLTSKNEGTPLSIIEAALMSRPVVATLVGAVDEVMTSGVTGFAIPAGDAKAFAEKLTLLAGDPQLRETMGKQALLLVKDKYSLTRQVESTRALYLLLLNRS